MAVRMRSMPNEGSITFGVYVSVFFVSVRVSNAKRSLSTEKLCPSMLSCAAPLACACSRQARRGQAGWE